MSASVSEQGSFAKSLLAIDRLLGLMVECAHPTWLSWDTVSRRWLDGDSSISAACLL